MPDQEEHADSSIEEPKPCFLIDKESEEYKEFWQRIAERARPEMEALDHLRNESRAQGAGKLFG